jgi:hypothetical protein
MTEHDAQSDNPGPRALRVDERLWRGLCVLLTDAEWGRMAREIGQPLPARATAADLTPEELAAVAEVRQRLGRVS